MTLPYLVDKTISLSTRSPITPLVSEMKVGATAGLPNSWSSWLWIRELFDPLLPVWPFLHACFFTFFSVCTKFTFQKRNWRTVICRVLPRPTKITIWTVVLLKIIQFPIDISVMDTRKYKNLVLTGEICGPSWRWPDLERIYILGLEITYLLMYFWNRSPPWRFRTKRYNETPLSFLRP